MAVEIEHKYLIDETQWKLETPEKSVRIKQGYLFSSREKTIRVRTKDNSGFITIKGKSVNASRPEYEYEIPLQEAEEMLNTFCEQVIEKTRFYIRFKNKLWEVDEFEGLNKGLFVAEIELSDTEETYEIPKWAIKNVSEDKRYTNAYLAQHPWTLW